MLIFPSQTNSSGTQWLTTIHTKRLYILGIKVTRSSITSLLKRQMNKFWLCLIVLNVKSEVVLLPKYQSH